MCIRDRLTIVRLTSIAKSNILGPIHMKPSNVSNSTPGTSRLSSSPLVVSPRGRTSSGNDYILSLAVLH
eukprot:3419926-Pyramimonas_sp.AAC.1